jgi:ornithine--oxo-acid transaminase
VLCRETHDRVLRIAPPLVITRDDIDWALARLARVFERTASHTTR